MYKFLQGFYLLLVKKQSLTFTVLYKIKIPTKGRDERRKNRLFIL